jgi:hypothetical protein
MEKQGYREGQGLGKELQGTLDPVAQSLQRQRAGLGYSTGGFTAQADWAMLPDAEPYTNPDLMWQPDGPGAGNPSHYTPIGPDSDILTYAWQHEQAPSLPGDVRNSKVLHTQEFLELKGTRRRALELLSMRTDGRTRRAFCQHRGAPNLRASLLYMRQKCEVLWGCCGWHRCDP